MRVTELVARRAAERPDAVAVSWAGSEMTYHRLQVATKVVTRALAGAAGTPVAVRMAGGPRLIATIVGVLDAGAQLICLGQADIGERGRAMLTEVRPSRLLIDDTADDRLAEWFTATLGGIVTNVAALDEEAGADVAADACTGSLEELAYVTYTSGTSGAPKGIPQNHATFSQLVTWFADEFGIGPEARVAQWAAPGYDAGLVEMFAALVSGATVCPVPDKLRANPDTLAEWLAAERITVLQTVPSFARGLLDALTERGGAGLQLARLLLAGEALPAELAHGLRAAIPGVRLINLYGPTETILATWYEVDGSESGTVPIGRPIPGRDVVVIDEAGRPCQPGVTGELVIRTPYRTPGYLGHAEAERTAFAPLPGHDDLPCYRTGDLAVTRADGVLEFLGRRDFQIKFNGVRLELTDIEAVLSAHDSVAECAVVAVRGADGLVARLVGHVVPRSDHGGAGAGSPGTWRRVLRERFGRAMPPVTFTAAHRLPRTPGGKVDHARLLAAGAGPATSTESGTGP